MAQKALISSTLFLTDFDVTIVVAPEDITTEAGSTVFITCVAYSENTPSITWIQNDNQTILDNSTSTRVTVYEELVTEGGLTFVQSILEVCSVEVADSGSYSCVASNGVRNDSTSFELTILPVGGKTRFHN